MQYKKIYGALLLAGVVAALVSYPGRSEAAPQTQAQRQRFEYLTCTVQFDRVTFVNGIWIGTVPYADGNTDVAIRSCPLIHAYLTEAGEDGWELVGDTGPGVPEGNAHTFFLKREK